MDGTGREPVHRNQSAATTAAAVAETEPAVTTTPKPRARGKVCPCDDPIDAGPCTVYNWQNASYDPTSALYIHGYWRAIGPCTLAACDKRNPCARRYPGAPVRPPLRLTAPQRTPFATLDSNGACVMYVGNGFYHREELDYGNWPAPRRFNCPWRPSE